MSICAQVFKRRKQGVNVMGETLHDLGAGGAFDSGADGEPAKVEAEEGEDESAAVVWVRCRLRR